MVQVLAPAQGRTAATALCQGWGHGATGTKPITHFAFVLVQLVLHPWLEEMGQK